MVIRPAKLSDMTAIKQLIGVYPKQLMQTQLPRSQDFFVAIVNKKIVGCCALQVYSRRMAEIRSLAVDKHFQGRGIASRLIDACIARAKKKRIYEILSITSAVPLFKKAGFESFQSEKYALLRVLG